MKDTQIRVIFTPMVSNPYQHLLIEKIRDHGLEITGVKKLSFSEIFSTDRPDILHLHWLHIFYLEKNLIKSIKSFSIFLIQILWLKLKGTKFVWTAHNLANHDQRHLFLDKICSIFICKISSKIITHCHKKNELIANTFQIKPIKKIETIHQGNYIDFYPNYVNKATSKQHLNMPESDELIFLYMGNIKTYKGVIELMTAFEKLNGTYEKIKLIIAGKPDKLWLRKEVEDRASRSNNILFFSDFVSDQELQFYFNASDIVVCPYQRIMHSGSILLAMSFGKACIAPSMGCIDEYLDSSGAFLYKTGENQDLYDALETAVLTDMKKIKTMGYYNLEKVKAWTWQEAAAKTVSIYQDILH